MQRARCCLHLCLLSACALTERHRCRRRHRRLRAKRDVCVCACVCVWMFAAHNCKISWCLQCQRVGAACGMLSGVKLGGRGGGRGGRGEWSGDEERQREKRDLCAAQRTLQGQPERICAVVNGCSLAARHQGAPTRDACRMAVDGCETKPPRVFSFSK